MAGDPLRSTSLSECFREFRALTQGASRLCPAELTGVLDSTLRVEDTRWLTAVLGYELPAEASFEVHLEGDGEARSASAHIQGGLNGMSNLSPALAPLIEPSVTVNADLELSRGKELSLSGVRVETDAFQRIFP